MEQKRLLVLGDDTGAKWHNRKELVPLLTAMKEAGYEIEQTEEYSSITVEKLKRYDGCVNYIDAWEERGTREAAAALLTWLEEGGRLLSLHNGIILKKSPGLLMAHGAEFIGHPEYELLHFPVEELTHPVLTGMHSFSLPEEPYRMRMLRTEGVEIFLYYEQNGERYPAAWTADTGRGKLVYLAAGHHADSFREPMFQQLCLNSLTYLLQ